MDYLISDKVILAEGYKNAAIYDLNGKKVYKINSIAKDIIKRTIIQGELPKSTTENEYLESLVSNGLYSSGYKGKELVMDRHFNIKLNFAWIEITQKCNLKCLHCYTGETHKQSDNSILADDWIKIIDQLSDLGCRSIQFIGGEPCVYPELISLIDYAGTKSFESITIFTNATIITGEFIDCLKRNNANIRFSLYGHTAQIHDAITQITGSFEKMVMNVKRLLELNIKISPAVVIMRENQHCTEQIKLFIESLGLKYNGYDVIRNVYGGRQTDHTPTNINVIDCSIRSKPEFYIDEEMFNKAYQINTCWYGKFAITETGMVIPCVFERNIILGDLKEQSIQEVLNSETLEKYWYLTLNQVEICKDCEFKYSCTDCRPLGMGNSGNLLGKNPRCTYDPYTGEWNNELNNSEDTSLNCGFFS